MRRVVPTFVLVGLAVATATCDSESPTQPPPVTTTTTVAPQPSPSPVPTPTPSPSADPGAQSCDLEPGPVTRLAISPREQRTDGETVDIRVRARPGWDEAWCLDRTKTHRIDFNANQRNASGRECCYEGDAAWDVDDPNDFVVGQSSRHDDGLIWRFNLEPAGRSGSLWVQASLDGVDSFPWQSGSGYTQGGLQIVFMNANEINRDCQCIFRGNGVYEGANCPK